MEDPESAVATSPVRADAAGTPASGQASGLTERLRAGDRQAMAEIFGTHLDVIYNYCFRRTCSWSAAEDLASTVFLEVWRTRRRAVEINGSVLPWLYGVATNVCRNYTRSQRRGGQAWLRLHPTDEASAPIEDEVVDRIAAAQRLAAVLERMSELPKRDQDVFVLVCWEELSYAETAQALGIAIGTVRSRLARVRRALTITDTQEGRDD